MQINTLYFSPTGTTQKVVNRIARNLEKNGLEKGRTIDFTLPPARGKAVSFTPEDVVIIGVPVYAGRVPNVLLKYLDTVQGNGALALVTVLYGNRHYDDALIELRNIMANTGFNVIAGAAFIGEHSFSRTLAAGRPDSEDMETADRFSQMVWEKLFGPPEKLPVSVKGNYPYRKYYSLVDEAGQPVDFRKVKPKTNENCIGCKLCAKVCPMGSIDFNDVSRFNGICIKCGACQKKCPAGAKYYDDENYLWHKKELEVKFADRKEPEFFL